MKKILSGMGHAIKDKVDLIISRLSKRNTKNNKWRKGVAGRSPVEKTPVMGAPGLPIKAHSASRRPYNAVTTKRHGTGFSFFEFLAGRKRLVLVACAAAAAVLIPVIAVSANADADNTRPTDAAEVAAIQFANQETAVPLAAGETEAAQETTEPQEQAEPTPTSEPTPEPKKYLTLEPETNHVDVIKLQQRLMDLHYMDNDEPTDYYGPHTQKCVSYFQRKNNLPVDGVAGETTQDLLFSNDAKEYSVAIGSEGDDVSEMQYRLQELGYSVAVTGYFGTDTEEKLQYFQRMNGLDDDGSMGLYTKDILFSEQAEPAEAAKKKSSGSSKSGGGGDGSSYTANAGSVDAFIDAALSQMGKPYRTAGKGPDSFDCSGFVYYALKVSGNGIGYMTSGGWASSGYATIGSMGDLQRGDIICFSGHVGIYLGGGEMVDASSGNGCVVRRGLGSWARNNFICGKRPL